MELKDRINAFAELGKVLKNVGSASVVHEKMEAALVQARLYNGWFTEENIRFALRALGGLLHPVDVEEWCDQYPLEQRNFVPKNIGVIMAGNIPLVGFHDFVCVLVSGHHFIGKLSADDKFLLPAVTEILCAIEPAFRERIIFLEGKLEKIDAVIATGSNNSSRYFDFYFAKYPHIIRKSRNSAAVLSGRETEEDMKLLGDDIFRYFGLGCRNVSKLFVPEGYTFDKFFEGIFSFKDVLQNNKYANNYEYNRTIYLMSKARIFDNNFLLLKEDIGMHSPVAAVYFEYYASADALNERLKMDSPNIQCVVGNPDLPGAIPFGSTQQPSLWDFADSVDTMAFLAGLN
jgi:hypothetical protein